jgi:hypothetical protein
MAEIHKTPDALEIIRSRRNIFAAAFCILPLAVLTWGLVSAASPFFSSDANKGAVVSLLLMSAVWIVIAGVILWNFFGKEILIIADGRVSLKKTTPFTIYKRSISIDTVTNVDIVRASFQEKFKDRFQLLISSSSRPLHFAVGLPPDELHKLLDEIRRFIETRTLHTLPVPQSAPTVEPLDSYEQYVRQQAAEEEAEKSKSIPQKALSWFAALVWTLVGIIWNLAIIATIISMIKRGNWLQLIILIPFLAAGLFLAIVAYCCVSVFIGEVRDILRGSKRIGRQPCYAERLARPQRSKNLIMPPESAGCIFIDSSTEYRGELNVIEEDNQFFMIFSTCLDRTNNNITDLLKIPVNQIRGVLSDGIFPKKLIVLGPSGSEHVFTGVSKVLIKVIRAAPNFR